MIIRQADRTDLAKIRDLWITASSDLQLRGYDQWQYPVRTDLIREEIALGESWVIDGENDLIATVAIGTRADLTYWPEHQNDAVYVHRMIVHPSYRGQHIGSALLDFASSLAERQDLQFVRLDAWRTNTDLHRFYQSEGFKLVRIVTGHGPSGACFERPVRVRSNSGPRLDTPQSVAG